MTVSRLWQRGRRRGRKTVCVCGGDASCAQSVVGSFLTLKRIMKWLPHKNLLLRNKNQRKCPSVPPVCPGTTSLFMPISTAGLCSPPPSASPSPSPDPHRWRWNQHVKRGRARERAREGGEKKWMLCIKSKWICGWLFQHATDWPNRQWRTEGGVGGRPAWPAGLPRQESPFNLNTYHHDNNLVTLSEANLFISRFFCCCSPSLLPPLFLLPFHFLAVIHSLSIILYILHHSQRTNCPVRCVP